MDKKTEYRLKRGKEMTSPFIRVFEGSMIAAVLLGIAMAAGPRISQAQAESKVSVLVDRLQRVRSHVAVCRAGGQDSDWDQLPANPFVADGERARTLTVVDDAEARPTGQEGTGWWYNTATGQFAACDSAYHAAY